MVRGVAVVFCKLRHFSEYAVGGARAPKAHEGERRRREAPDGGSGGPSPGNF